MLGASSHDALADYGTLQRSSVATNATTVNTEHNIMNTNGNTVKTKKKKNKKQPQSEKEEVAKMQQAEAEVDCVAELFDVRWQMLLLLCLLPVGGYYVYDFPTSLGMGLTSNTYQNLFRSRGIDYTASMNLVLYSVYSWPSTVSATLGGILMDNVLGIHRSMFLFALLVTLGSLIFYVGVATVSFPVMVVGRFVFGMGNESLWVTQLCAIGRYFSGKWGVSLAYCLALGFSRLGFLLNSLFSSRLAQSTSVETATLAGVFSSLFALVIAVLIICIERRRMGSDSVDPQAKLLLIPECRDFTFKRFTNIDPRSWILFASCAAIFCVIYSSQPIAANLFQVKYGIAASDAAAYVAVFQLASASIALLVGNCCDALGRPAVYLTLASVGFAAIQIAFLAAEWTIHPVVLMIAMGFTYVTYAASLWPGIALVSSPFALGRVFGICDSLQNTFLAIYPLVVDAILTAYPGADRPCSSPPLSGACLNFSHSGFTNTSGFKPGSLINCPNTTDCNDNGTGSSTSATLASVEGYDRCMWLFSGTSVVGILLGIALIVVDHQRRPSNGNEIEDDDRILTINATEIHELYQKKLVHWIRVDQEYKAEDEKRKRTNAGGFVESLSSADAGIDNNDDDENHNKLNFKNHNNNNYDNAEV